MALKPKEDYTKIEIAKIRDWSLHYTTPVIVELRIIPTAPTRDNNFCSASTRTEVLRMDNSGLKTTVDGCPLLCFRGYYSERVYLDGSAILKIMETSEQEYQRRHYAHHPKWPEESTEDIMKSLTEDK